MKKALSITPFDIPTAWEARTLHDDPSWIIHLTDSHRDELIAALNHFKEYAHAHGLTAQWLHGNMTPIPETFPLPTLQHQITQARIDMEEKYGLVLFKGFPVENQSLKDLHLMHAGLCSHIGTIRPQTVFGEMVQDIRDNGQASLKERRGSKHNRALSFHNDPSDAISFLCINPSKSGGLSRFCSSLAIHNALLNLTPEHVETLYQDFTHLYQDYLFVRTGWKNQIIPEKKFYNMPLFTVEQDHFACKYSRFYIDEAQGQSGVPDLSRRQKDALNAFEEELGSKKWQLELQYERGDVMFINNFVCFHARTSFLDDEADEKRRRHLLRIWLSVPNSRPLAPSWLRQVFFRDVQAGVVRGGVPAPEVSYS